MLESTKVAASKFGLDARFIEAKANTEKNIRVLGNDLTFLDVRESERTKHVHRLQPYLGMFIPQLVHVFLKKYLRRGQMILDPFAGFGTTLIEANVLGMNSVGVELSPFNDLIQKVKTQEYDIPRLDTEVRDALSRPKSFSNELTSGSRSLFPQWTERFHTSSDYLRTWFSDRALQALKGALQALKDLPRPGRPPLYTDDARVWVLSVACVKPVDLGYADETWTYSLLIKHIRGHCDSEGHPCLRRLGKGQLHAILSRSNIKPHKVSYYLERRAPEFAEKPVLRSTTKGEMANVLCVYKQVAMHRLSGADRSSATVSYDEKPGIQAILEHRRRPAAGSGQTRNDWPRLSIQTFGNGIAAGGD